MRVMFAVCVPSVTASTPPVLWPLSVNVAVVVPATNAMSPRSSDEVPVLETRPGGPGGLDRAAGPVDQRRGPGPQPPGPNDRLVGVGQRRRRRRPDDDVAGAVVEADDPAAGQADPAGRHRHASAGEV